MKIAKATPFEGKPIINSPSIYGASPNKDIMYKIAVIGERPISISADGLPKGLKIENGIITGKIKKPGDYRFKIFASNKLGSTEKNIRFEISDDHILLTPLMGFTSWNAFGVHVSQKDIMSVAQIMAESGIAEYGYSYINIDSGWQGEYGGKYDAVMPNEKFPDMKSLCRDIHAMGFKCGIYSSPMRSCMGGNENIVLPGCTKGERDDRFCEFLDGIGKIRREKNNVRQWEEWGFDYLKYDWLPADAYNADIMKQALLKSKRDFGFCVTCQVVPQNHIYWSKYANSFRNSVDSYGSFDNLIQIYHSRDVFIDSMNKGHYYDLDMLDIGECGMDDGAGIFNYTDDEKVVSYSLRAFLNSPIQLSCDLSHLSEFEYNVFCNEEMIAISQDSLCDIAKMYCSVEENGAVIHVYKRELENGDQAFAIFNFGEAGGRASLSLSGATNVRDVWAKENLGKTEEFDSLIPPHSVRIIRVSYGETP